MWIYAFLFSFTLISPVVSSYHCLCTHQKQTAVFGSRSDSSVVLGHMYEYDCKPRYPQDAFPGGNSEYYAIQYEGKIGYIKKSAVNSEFQECSGSIPSVDMVTTVSTVTSIAITATSPPARPTTTPPATTTARPTTTTTMPTTKTTRPITTMSPYLTCPPGWLIDESSCYLFILEKKSFQDAKSYCGRLHAHLVHINTHHEHNLIKEFLKIQPYNHIDPIWTGGMRANGASEWYWKGSEHTMTEIQEFEWLSGHPTIVRQSCISISGHQDNYHWVDSRCSHTNYFLCERDISPSSVLIG